MHYHHHLPICGQVFLLLLFDHITSYTCHSLCTITFISPKTHTIVRNQRNSVEIRAGLFFYFYFICKFDCSVPFLGGYNLLHLVNYVGIFFYTFAHFTLNKRSFSLLLSYQKDQQLRSIFGGPYVVL